MFKSERTETCRGYAIVQLDNGWLIVNSWGFSLHEDLFDNEMDAQHWLEHILVIDAGMAEWD